MNYFYLISGILLYTGTLCDLAFTTFSSSRAGYLTEGITKGMWRASLRLCGGDGSKKMLEYIGIFTIGTIVFVWFLCIWVGSTLIILSDPASVIDASTYAKAGSIEKLYFIGYTLTTMGNGDFKASGYIWQLFSVFLSFSGFMLITTAVTYMLPVLSADILKKKISKKIFILGSTPQELLLNMYDKGNFNLLEKYLPDLTEIIITHSQQLLAYPVLYNFHSANVYKSAAISIAVLDEALTILLLHIPEENRPGNLAIMPLRKAIMDFLKTLNHNFTKGSDTAMVLPTLGMLQEAGIGLIKEEADRKKLYDQFARRRELISVLLQNEGWQFKHIYVPKFDSGENA